MVFVARIGIFDCLIESLVMLQILKAVHDIGANFVGAFFTIKTVIAVQVGVFVSEQIIAPFILDLFWSKQKPHGGCTLPLRGLVFFFLDRSVSENIFMNLK